MRKENERWVLGGGVLLFAALVLLPFLGTYGLWDPQEITVADAAQKLARQMDFGVLWRQKPPLTPWLIGTSVSLFGPSELSARLPIALLGLVGAFATYALGARLGRRRAGAIAAVVLLSSPLYVFQSRQLVSDVATVVATTIAMLGLVGLAWPDPHKPRWRTPVDVVLVCAGLAMGVLSAGLWLGVFVPLAASAAAAAAYNPSRRFAIGAGVAAVAVLGLLVLAIFHTEAAQPGARAVVGRMFVAAKDYLPWLGGIWRKGEAPMGSVGFDNVVNQVAFGLYPWTAIAPIAVLRFAVAPKRDHAAFAGLVLLAWALVAYLATAIFWRAVGDVRYAALPAIALAIGVFVDDLLAAKLDGDEGRAPDAAAGLRIAAVFVALAAVILALDTHNFHDTLPSIHILGSPAVFPKELLPLEGVIVFFGCAMGTLLAAGLAIAAGPGKLLGVERRTFTTGGLLGAVGLGGLYGLFLSLVLVPQLAHHFSYKNLFQSYFDHKKGDEPVGVMGIPGSGPDFYAHGKLTRLESTTQLFAFLKRPERVFAILPRDKLCEVHQQSLTQSVALHVLDRNSRFNLFTNQLAEGEKDVNPLLDTFHKEPEKIARPVAASFDDSIDLLGVDMPDRVSRGERFSVTLWYRVKKRPTANYKVFMHFDIGSTRFQGDHDQPGVCPTSFWKPGDIIADTFDVTAGGMTHPTGTHTVYTGFFTGGNGAWKNMPVTAGEHDKADRANLGTIRVD